MGTFDRWQGTNLPIAADELKQAIANGLLTQAEARKVYWLQFPELGREVATTPPEVPSV